MALIPWILGFELHFFAFVIAEYPFTHGNTLTLCGDPSYKFRSFGNTSLSSCITECGRRPKCLALNHRQLYSNLCELFETRNTVANINKDCLYLRREDISFSGVLSNGCGCAVGESCDLQTTTCSKSECFPLRTLANGKIIGNKYGIGNSLAIRCNQGFESLNGVTSVTCLSTGEWSQSPSCNEVCNPPPNLQNGNISGSSYSQGSSLDVICAANYYEVNNIQSITCLSSAVWSVVPRCVLKECNPPTYLSNGYITGSEYTIGSTMTVLCNLGYREESNITSIVCLDSLQWDMTPNCVLRECDSPPSFSFGHLSSSLDYTVGTTLSIFCDNGYGEANGLTYITCLQTATWDFVPECTILDCGSPPTFSFGHLSSSLDYTVGTTLSIFCDNGYEEANGLTYITCLHTATWDFVPQCTILDCGSPPSFSFGHLSSSLDYTVGTTLSIFCENGYEEANGLTYITCLQNATWDFVPECTIIDCGSPPSFSFGHLSSSLDYTVGTTLSIFCDNGYEEANGLTYITCLQTATWDFVPECTILDCGSPPSFSFGHLSSSLDYTVGTTLSIFCENGYEEANGLTYITCLQNATWDFVPECTIIDCGSPPSFSFGHLSSSLDYTVGTTLSIFCDNGYGEANGLTYITCLQTATWDFVPECTILDCGSPPSFSFGHLSSSLDYTVGTTLSIFCDNGYEEANGLTYITCLQTATWDFVPECTILDCGSPPSFSFGHLSSSLDYTVGTTLSIFCDNGYEEANGLTYITCLQTATWDFVPECTILDCGSPPSFSFGHLSSSLDYTVGTTLSIFCDNGYGEANGLTYITCLQTATWNFVPECTILDCGSPPSFSFGHLSSSLDYTVGTTLSISCDNGYEEANGLTYITCLHTATWDFVPECTVIECSQPTLVDGVVSGDIFTVGSTLGISCNTNYVEINGISTITCMGNGYWDNTPLCVAASFCTSNWILVGSSCFYISTSGDGNKDYTNSKTFCIGQGGNLARLDSSEKYEAIRNELNGQSNTVNNYWIGLRKYSSNGPMTWLDNGVEYVYHNFASGEPGTNNEYCAFLWKNDGWQWHAGQCNWSNRFVCEKPAS